MILPKIFLLHFSNKFFYFFLFNYKSVLVENQPNKENFIYNDKIFFDPLGDNADLKVIKNDVNRTRIKDQELIPEFKENMEKILSLYCKVYEIKYKQGLNEIFAPFLLLKAKFNLEFFKVFNLASSFIDKFLTNYYFEEEFFCLQSSLALLNNLLKYHNPVVYNIFEYSLITPQMYATSWILTIFAK